MQKVFIYIDEFGTSALSQKDIKNITHFVYCAVAIKETDKGRAHKARNDISNSLLDGNPIKSSSKAVRKNDKKRLEILRQLTANANFTFSLLVVNKLDLEKDKGGLRFKEVFYKFFQKLLTIKFRENYNDFEMVMDSTISDNYMKDVRRYLGEKVHNSLFDTYTFKTEQEEPLIQVADIIVGSYGKIFNNDFKSGIEEEIFDILRPNLTGIDQFPLQNDNDSFKPLEAENVVNEQIYNIVKVDGIRVLEELRDITQKIALEQLIWQHNFLPTQYIKSYDLQHSVSMKFGKEVSMEALRIIIRELRYKGIIVVTHPSYGGYKLAINENDISLYFQHSLKYISPMLDKIEIANNVFKRKTGGDFIPLDSIDTLKSLVDSYMKSKVIEK